MLRKWDILFQPKLVVRGLSIHSTTRSKKYGSSADNKNNKAKLSMPPEFEKKIKSWPLLLDKEMKEQTKELDELLGGHDYQEIFRRGLGQTKLRVLEYKMDYFTGRVVKFRIMSDCQYKGKANFSINKGIPVVVCAGKSFQRIAEAVITNYEKNIITCKLTSNSNVIKFDEDCEYSIARNITKGPLQVLNGFLKYHQTTSFRNAPGVKLIQYAYRALQMPTVYQDRNVVFNTSFNESQIRAINAAVNKNRPFVCIQGPPGTGKTKVLSEIILRLVQNKQKVLVCAPTNVAVDNAYLNVRNQTSILLNSDEDLESLVLDKMEEHPDYEKWLDVTNRLHGFEETSSSIDRNKLLKEANFLRRNLVASAFSTRSVVFCTLSSSLTFKVLSYGWHPDVVIIDEAAQCTEPYSWMPILSGKRCILAGDQQQLPAFVVSEEAIAAGLKVSLMERLDNEFKNCNLNFLLNIQYRMNEKIMGWSSDTFYESKLTAADNVKSIMLSEISSIPQDSVFNCPLIHIDTSGIESVEKKVEQSYVNDGEAEIVCDYVKKLIDAGVRVDAIGVISPYAGQVNRLKSLIGVLGVSVNTVDGFQGQEKQVIVFSMVRENTKNTVGFLSDSRRLNVAVTRAKRQFVLIGSSDMLDSSSTLDSLILTIQDQGEVVKASAVKNIQSLRGSISDDMMTHLRARKKTHKTRRKLKAITF